MSTELPQAIEVPLENPPIREVIAQVRFPELLALRNELPIAFQEATRFRFPEFTQEASLQFAVNHEEPKLNFSSPLFRFSNRHTETDAVLSASFFAVTTRHYTGWRVFLADLEYIYTTVSQIYNPIYATRLGLRYINHLTYKNTGTESREALLRLVRPELTATLQGDIWTNADEMIGVVSFADQEGRLNLRYGYEVSEPSPTFLLDFDYFEEGEIALENLLSRYDRYHTAIYNAFRWCVTDETLLRFGGVV